MSIKPLICQTNLPRLARDAWAIVIRLRQATQMSTSPLTVGEYVSPCLDLDDHEVRSISTLLSCYPINHASRGGVFGMANEGIVQR